MISTFDSIDMGTIFIFFKNIKKMFPFVKNIRIFIVTVSTLRRYGLL